MQTAVILGTFDGVHIAHAKLIRDAVAHAAANGLLPLAYILEPHPRILLGETPAPRLLTDFRTKEERICALGAAVYKEERGKKILSLSPEEFVRDILKKELDAGYAAAGFNYRFGKNAAGDAAQLSALCEKYGICCHITESIAAEGAVVSSTRLRALLAAGDVEAYNRLSSAPYTVSGKVVCGRKLGRAWGFPTINITLDDTLLYPPCGVYISRTRIRGKIYTGLTNIGINPTVGETLLHAETHLFHFSGTVYGLEAETALLRFIRKEERFPSAEALRAQIKKDKETAERFFERKENICSELY